MENFIQVLQFYHAIGENMSGKKNLNRDVNCLRATCIMLTSKGKGHKLVETMCVQWLL
jgi:hypothetical protein